MAKRRTIQERPSGPGSGAPVAPSAEPAARAAWRRWIVPSLVLLAAASGWWWRAGVPLAPPRPSRPNVVLITLDTTRADRIGAYGYAAAATPHLDRLARDGARFALALSPVPLTLPAHASVMTGRHPYGHGVRNNGYFVLGTDVPTLAERFAAAGYDTAAFVSSFVLDRQFGLARGFAHYDDALDPPRGTGNSLELERRGDRTVAAASAWLAARVSAPDTPYFLWVHLYDAHEPYDPPSAFRSRFEHRAYDGEIAFQDALVGDLLARIGYGTARSPLVVVAGDHGESLGDHGESTHGLFVYDSALRVPLIIAWPGVLAPRVVAPAVTLADVAPTVTALAGLPPLADIHGESLAAVLDGKAGAPRGLYAETYFPQFFMGWAPLRSIRDGRWKYIDAPEPELYDVDADPGETINRATLDTAAARGLRRRLEDIVRGQEPPSAAPLSEDARRKLTALGYVSTAALPAGGAGAGPARDPKQMVGVFERLTGANRALAEGRPAEAAGIARDVVASDEGNHFARLVLGRAQLATGASRAAIDTFRAYLTAVPGSADAHHWIALAHLRLGDRASALTEEDAALALDPRHGAARALRAGLLFSAGRKDEGVQSLADAVRADPLNHTLRVAYADLLADAGRGADAEAEYRRVLAVRPGDVGARLGLGLLLARSDRFEAAIGELSQVLDLAPADDEARFERAVAYERLGRHAEARAEYERLDAPDTRPDIRQAARARRTAVGR
jgi:choline-sulfatase